MDAFLPHDLAARDDLAGQGLSEQELQAESGDGYPVLELLGAGLPSAVVRATLGNWVAQLARYLNDLAQADTDALIQLRERIRISHSRLQRLQAHWQAEPAAPQWVQAPPRLSASPVPSQWGGPLAAPSFSADKPSV